MARGGSSWPTRVYPGMPNPGHAVVPSPPRSPPRLTPPNPGRVPIPGLRGTPTGVPGGPHVHPPSPRLGRPQATPQGKLALRAHSVLQGSPPISFRTIALPICEPACLQLRVTSTSSKQRTPPGQLLFRYGAELFGHQYSAIRENVARSVGKGRPPLRAGFPPSAFSASFAAAAAGGGERNHNNRPRQPRPHFVVILILRATGFEPGYGILPLPIPFTHWPHLRPGHSRCGAVGRFAASFPAPPLCPHIAHPTFQLASWWAGVCLLLLPAFPQFHKVSARTFTPGLLASVSPFCTSGSPPLPGWARGFPPPPLLSYHSLWLVPTFLWCPRAWSTRVPQFRAGVRGSGGEAQSPPPLGTPWLCYPPPPPLVCIWTGVHAHQKPMIHTDLPPFGRALPSATLGSTDHTEVQCNLRRRWLQKLNFPRANGAPCISSVRPGADVSVDLHSRRGGMARKEFAPPMPAKQRRPTDGRPGGRPGAVDPAHVILAVGPKKRRNAA